MSLGVCVAVERHVPSESHPTIQSAINASADGDEVVVEPGTYSGSGNRDLDFGGRAITVRSADPNDPNVVAATILDGGQVSLLVRFDDGEGPNSVLAGLTISRGLGAAGGGICCYNASPTVKNCVITGNWAPWGGGMLVISGSPAIVGCTFRDNEALVAGGGMGNLASSHPLIEDCTFERNWTIAGSGGAINNFVDSSPVVRNCAFLENEAAGGNGGAIFCYSNSNPLVTGCTFEENSSTYGGAVGTMEASPTFISCRFVENVGVHGGAMDNTNGGHPIITDCDFIGNTATWGGGVDDWDCSATITGCRFIGNAADDGGGGGMVNFGGSWLMMADCTFVGNRTRSNYGGGLSSSEGDAVIRNCRFIGNWSGLDGGGMVAGDSNVVMENCTVTGNEALEDGGGITDLANRGMSIWGCTIADNRASGDGDGLFIHDSSPSLENTIVWSNAQTAEPEIVLVGGESPAVLTVFYCDVPGGPNAVAIDPNCTLLWGDGNLDVEPNVVSGASGTWSTDGVYDPDTYQITFIDANASWEPGALAVRSVNPDTTQPLQLLIVDNTMTSLTAWANADMIKDPNNIPSAGASYRIYDYHLQAGSPCVDAADPNADYAGETDIDGQCRANGPADIGADEVWPNVVHALDVVIVNSPFGSVSFDPIPSDANTPAYPAGTIVTLLAEPTPGRAFGGWKVYDPNYPGDPNHVSADANALLTLVMDGERQVEAVFKCGTGVGPMLTLLAIGVLCLSRPLGRQKWSEVFQQLGNNPGEIRRHRSPESFREWHHDESSYGSAPRRGGKSDRPDDREAR